MLLRGLASVCSRRLLLSGRRWPRLRSRPPAISRPARLDRRRASRLLPPLARRRDLPARVDRALESPRPDGPSWRARPLRVPRRSRRSRPPADRHDGQVAKNGTSGKAKPGAAVKMLGINCAACHVGEMTHGGRTYRIDGAPNVLMDIIAFNTDLTASVARIAATRATSRRSSSGSSSRPRRRPGSRRCEPDVLKVLQALAAWDRKDGAHQMADALAAALTPLFQPKTSSWPLVDNIMVMPPLDQPVTLEFMSAACRRSARRRARRSGAFLKANSGAGAPLGVLDPDPIAAAQKLMELTEHVVNASSSQTIWYLKQAVGPDGQAGPAPAVPRRHGLGTRAGGRLPAGAEPDRRRNLLMGKPPTSPTSYPRPLGERPREVAGLGRQRRLHDAAEHRHGAGHRGGLRPRFGDVIDPAGRRLSAGGHRLEGRTAEVAVRADQRGNRPRGVRRSTRTSARNATSIPTPCPSLPPGRYRTGSRTCSMTPPRGEGPQGVDPTRWSVPTRTAP